MILELKYRGKPVQKLADKQNKILANVARKSLSRVARYESLAKIVSKNLDTNKIKLILSELSDDESTETKENYLLAQFALKSFPDKDINDALAATVLEKLPRDRLEKELLNLGVKIDLPQKTEDLSDERN
ncbi:MAG: hypothetical protein LBR11_06160 [Deltaproteobacteria bacterium]|nr:hypothetical protein [Deltaproteobacteria bacterium]